MSEKIWTAECRRCKHVLTCTTGVSKAGQLCIRFEERKKDNGRR